VIRRLQSRITRASRGVLDTAPTIGVVSADLTPVRDANRRIMQLDALGDDRRSLLCNSLGIEHPAGSASRGWLCGERSFSEQEEGLWAW